jgi:histidine triad (HIT) family protein
MSDTVFGKIIAGEIPTNFVYEDDLCVVFKDINPKSQTHLLIVPRKAISSIAEMEEGDSEIIGHLFWVAKKLGDELGLKGYRLQVNVGKDGGQEVFHLHVHLLSNFG